MYVEYEDMYDSGYEWGYDQNFVYEDEVDLEGVDDDEDLVLDEIPSIYCPSTDEVGEA